jgi:hypothetical protein
MFQHDFAQGGGGAIVTMFLGGEVGCGCCYRSVLNIIVNTWEKILKKKTLRPRSHTI